MRGVLGACIAEWTAVESVRMFRWKVRLKPNLLWRKPNLPWRVLRIIASLQPDSLHAMVVGI